MRRRASSLLCDHDIRDELFVPVTWDLVRERILKKLFLNSLPVVITRQEKRYDLERQATEVAHDGAEGERAITLPSHFS